jgi:hypothetical protein
MGEAAAQGYEGAHFHPAPEAIPQPTQVDAYEGIDEQNPNQSDEKRSDQAGSAFNNAYCHKGKRLKERSASVTVPAFPAADSLTARCERGEKVVSGGFDSPDFGADFGTDPQVLPVRSMKTGKRKWKGSAYLNSPFDGSGTFTVYAYCEKKKK